MGCCETVSDPSSAGGTVSLCLSLFSLWILPRIFIGLDWRKSAFALPVAWNLVLCVPVGKSGLFLVGIGKAMGGEILGLDQHGAEANSDSRLCDRLFAELHLRHNHLAVCLCHRPVFL